MKNNKKRLIYTIFSILIFLIFWAILKLFEKYNLINIIYIKWFIFIIFTGIFGTLLPVILKNRFKFEYVKKVKKTNKIIGLIILILILLAGLIFSGIITKVIQKNYSIVNLIKYILLIFPLALGISFFSFLLIPEVVEKFELKKYWKLIISISSIFLFFFLGFFIDSSFENLRLSIILAFFGFAFSLANWFYKNFWISFFGFFIFIFIITLEKGIYIDYPIIVIIIRALISLLILIFDSLKIIKSK